MPATEKPWYDQKLLHVVFGFSGLAMLIATVWMFAADHNREWKDYQRRYRDLEQRLTKWRIREAKSADQQTQFATLQQQLVSIQTHPPAATLYEAFRQEALRDDSGDSARSRKFDSLDQRYAQIEELAQVAAGARKDADAARAEAEDRQAQLTNARQKLVDASAEEREAAEQAEKQADNAYQTARAAVEDTADTAVEAEREAVAERGAFLDELQKIVDRAKFEEEQLLSRRKFRSADSDAAKANLDLAIRDNRAAEEMAALQQIIDEIVEGPGGLDELTRQRQDATSHRDKLQSLLRQMAEQETEVRKALEENQAEVARLESSLVERRSTYFVSSPPFLGKKWLELPILDAFSSPLKIDNLWTENLTVMNGSFGKVRRFDRCTTCHKGIDKTQAGSAVLPAYLPEQQLQVTLATPPSEPAPETDTDGKALPLTLQHVYGFQLAEYGLVDDDDVTIDSVDGGSLAATAAATDAHGEPVTAGLQVGDVILFVNDDKPLSRQDARQFLIEGAEWGEPVTLTIRRGLPQPFTSHPRLDLYVGSLSPHTLAVMGCTSCHEGQGSATSFMYASHSPSSVRQEDEWKDEHGWFLNHHWILPMYPARFAESSCLKCHHEVAELEASERFPEPPAPKLVEGWQLIGTYGCYGCHEINGYDGPDRRVGPDLRLEPNYHAAAAAVQADPGFDQLDESIQEMSRILVQQPFRDQLRRDLRQFLLDDAAAEQPLLTGESQKMADVLQDQETPGKRRKVGPSLRYVADKLGAPFMFDWVREPKNYRPSTQMPQFFGLWDHLDPDNKQATHAIEQVEVLGIVTYLLNRSQPFEYLEPAEGTSPASVERGKVAFEVRGCLACHQHDDFPYGKATHGPDLTHLADKFSTAAGAPDAKGWLYSWIKRPAHYHARTKMPDLYLDPIEAPDGSLTDPVSDIVEYLLSSSRGWEPPADTVAALSPESSTLDALVLELLEATFPRRRAEEYIQTGIPEAIGRTLKGVEVELVGEISDDKKLMYVGRKAISKYGCNGCHDIPGFEDAKPIGTAIADWGRKEPSKLAFEHILEYLHQGGHGGGHAGSGQMGAGARETSHSDAGHGEASQDPSHDRASELAGGHGADGEEPDDAFFREQLQVHERSGFIWQKMKEPRSYDYKKTENKRYTERLRMPLFPINPQQREAIVTFVLGLVADPPEEQFVYDPGPRQDAIVQGRRVLEKYNCAGCHILQPEKWHLEFEPGELGSTPSVPDYPFLATQFSHQELADSLKEDPRRGLISAEISGMPAISNDDATPLVLDEEGDELDPEWEYDPDTLLYPFELWKPVALEGEPYEVGLRRLTVPATAIRKRWDAKGGDLTRWLLPRVIELAKQTNPNANGTEAWAWLPPPLHGEGRKVQPAWLHSFLLEPYPIRPAVFLRMPKFNLSPTEAAQLVNYFTATDAVDFPFEYDDRLLASHLPEKEAFFDAQTDSDESRLEHAMRIVTNQNYCIKCHSVGDYVPQSDVRALAPQLADVQFRLRPEYLRKWIANPTRLLPYTAMPVNVPFDPNSDTWGGVAQGLYPGSSIEQVDGLVDLLMNYSQYANSQHSVTDLVEQAAAEASDSETPAAEAEAEDAEEKPAAAAAAGSPPDRELARTGR